MFKVNEDGSIYLTRGDAVDFSVSASKNAQPYTFLQGEEVQIKVFAKKECENVVLQKKFTVENETETVPIFLTGEETKIGETISKPVDYWYEIELNPDTDPQTIVGYDEDGPKVFRLYPEGGEVKA